MKRRDFLQYTGLTAMALSISGFKYFNGTTYVGDCETTTDILGPFYRPESPLKNNLVIPGLKGEIVEISGVIRRPDCQTVIPDAKIELWHCDPEGVYDNHSDAFKYRGTTFSDENGKYIFKTQMPIPYDAGNGNIRPAHFHFLFSASGYQDLITQIYFKGDPHLENDIMASNPKSELRILNINTENGHNHILFDCTMKKKLDLSFNSFRMITGKYQNVNNNIETIELFEHNKSLWIKNQVFGTRYDYIGKNKFRLAGLPDDFKNEMEINIDEMRNVSVLKTTIAPGRIKETIVYKKI
ncbi:catechol 1,2-dioxygenase [Mangrovivirga sp. M17]|uniref:Catechol 1,2-dioxygenase n=1 Tax=Mangrovivirga halotolerans TaxID=2993936 RepID=A0ABT3RQF4_9BACT|nr:catechol 1,2-dioxygenase [Mangrovivirga halotolerans]MCX2744020.1 catechol 1,2-dioxygenase [Mangrovivirga halotolerans]